ncbi:tRNA cyclic N6-threonylcarbamoyladenosine(37) synthase TcdA [Motiliproteus coralliicola]|uniref:tRNA threonylcarbamoyladenosine dehydratase n=1 Tax=Motiliproteus coralliicola TaxID=2283196 RepID=A0A369WQZ0_9GAMM|nr:tRNA cyclic N6-threonylcarbamoyladenosine(37) synthase TcdA [Motiliproteus coralliicola]RDE24490.1 tRNA cyclic N6-threonylcarbamoyladenosine(37) synthase TcdA [Motiliproteus coralliicola]
MDQRFGGTRRLYGTDGVEALAKAHVCVIGIGGVGSWVVEALARSAVGELTLIDLDDLCVTNTNRQIHALSQTIGQSKVAVMAERVEQINPDCRCHQVEEFIDEQNAWELLDQRFDYVIDAIDDVRAKAAIIACCRRRKIPVITIGGAGGQVDPTRIDVADLSRTEQDPLAAKVRSHLRRFYNFSTNPKRRFDVPCVYSSEQLRYPQPDGSVCGQKRTTEEGEGMRLDCNTGFGASTCVTATFGFVAVARVIDKLIERATRQAAASS